MSMHEWSPCLSSVVRERSADANGEIRRERVKRSQARRDGRACGELQKPMGVWGATPIGIGGKRGRACNQGRLPSLSGGDWATHTLLSDNGEKTRQRYR